MFQHRHRLFSATAAMLLMVGALTACSDPQPVAVAPPPTAAVATTAPAAAAPVIVNAAPAASSGMSDMLVGGALGYALANANGAGAARAMAPPTQHTTVNKTVVHKTVVVNKTAPPVHLAKAPADTRTRSTYTSTTSRPSYTSTSSASRSSWSGGSSSSFGTRR